MFRFTIRDLLWLMVVVGLAVGWYCDRTSFRSRYRALLGVGSKSVGNRIPDHMIP
jgi:hypothetical protein